MNQNVAKILDNLYEEVGKGMKKDPDSVFSQMPKLLSFENPKNKSTSKSLEIFLELYNFDKIVNVYEEGCRYSEEEKMKLISESHKWKFSHTKKPEDFRIEDLE